MTILGLMATTMRRPQEEVKTLTSCCWDNKLSLNVSKSKAMIGDYRRQQVHTEVEMVSSFKFLSVHITEDLSWSLNTDTMVKKFASGSIP